MQVAQYSLTSDPTQLFQMKAKVIIPQQMQSGEGFMLLGFSSNKKLAKEEMDQAVMNVCYFQITGKNEKEKVKMGFEVADNSN